MVRRDLDAGAGSGGNSEMRVSRELFQRAGDKYRLCKVFQGFREMERGRDVPKKGLSNILV